MPHSEEPADGRHREIIASTDEQPIALTAGDTSGSDDDDSETESEKTEDVCSARQAVANQASSDIETVEAHRLSESAPGNSSRRSMVLNDEGEESSDAEVTQSDSSSNLSENDNVNEKQEVVNHQSEFQPRHEDENNDSDSDGDEASTKSSSESTDQDDTDDQDVGVTGDHRQGRNSADGLSEVTNIANF